MEWEICQRKLWREVIQAFPDYSNIKETNETTRTVHCVVRAESHTTELSIFMDNDLFENLSFPYFFIKGTVALVETSIEFIENHKTNAVDQHFNWKEFAEML